MCPDILCVQTCYWQVSPRWAPVIRLHHWVVLLLTWVVRRKKKKIKQKKKNPLAAFCRVKSQQGVKVTWGPETQLTHLLRTTLCKFLSKTACTDRNARNSRCPFFAAAKTLLLGSGCFFLNGPKLCKFIMQHSLNEEKCCSGSRFVL